MEVEKWERAILESSLAKPSCVYLTSKVKMKKIVLSKTKSLTQDSISRRKGDRRAKMELRGKEHFQD